MEPPIRSTESIFLEYYVRFDLLDRIKEAQRNDSMVQNWVGKV